MELNLEISGNFNAPKVFLFQDLRFSRETFHGITKILEPFFRVYSLHLPPPQTWIQLHPWDKIQQEFQGKVYPILEQSEKFVGICAGFCYPFWRKLLGSQENRLTKLYILEPEWIVRTPMDRILGFQDYPSLEVFPNFAAWALFPVTIFQYATMDLDLQTHFPSYPIHFICFPNRLRNGMDEVRKIKNTFSKSQLEWSRLAEESRFPIKISTTLKKFLLLHLAKEFGIQEERIFERIRNW